MFSTFQTAPMNNIRNVFVVVDGGGVEMESSQSPHQNNRLIFNKSQKEMMLTFPWTSDEFSSHADRSIVLAVRKDAHLLGHNCRLQYILHLTISVGVCS